MKANRQIAVSLAGAALLVALEGGASFWAFHQIQKEADARKNAFTVLNRADELLSALKDAETGQRGYLLTDDESFLEPYLAVRDKISAHFEALRHLALGSASHEHLDALRPLIDAKLAELAHVIELHRNHDATAAQAIVVNGQGKRLMDSIREEMLSFRQIEGGALAQHAEAFQTSMRHLFIVIAIANLFTLLLALSFAYFIYRETQQRLDSLVHLETVRLLELQRETNAELQRAKSAAEKANLAKSDFLSSMSHELRSPLNAILGFAQLLDSDSPPPTPAQKDSIGQILQAGWHLLALINEILDLSKIESGQVPMSQEPVSLAEVMLECQHMIEPQAKQRGIHMTFPRFDLPRFVHADRIRVKQVLVNLLSNAIKYNTTDGTVDVACAESTPGRIRVSIRDTGAGLTPEKVAQLYQPFNRLGQEAGGEEGTGIGLVVAKRLIELMGGLTGVESTVGVGSVFWFELASVAEPRLAMEQGDAALVAQAPAPHETRRHTLLYVEDNPANMKLVEQLIARRPDIRLMTAVNGDLGIEIARAARPTAILMDINLPGISGMDALKILLKDPATAHIPIIALSANAMPRDIEKGMEAGFFRYITKPIKVKEFMDTLDVALAYAERDTT